MTKLLLKMKELTRYGVDDISVKDVFKLCFKTTNDSTFQLLKS